MVSTSSDFKMPGCTFASSRFTFSMPSSVENEAMRQAELIQKEKESASDEYTEDKFQSDLKELQRAAREYAGL